MTPDRWRQIEDLYHAALERGRAALADADPELRAEVEKLLRQDSGGKILDNPAAELLTDSTFTVFAPGSKLGPYRIDAKLGAGGIGEVFRATDTRLGRDVAIKTSHARFSDRFEREARAIAALNHPHICTLYDVGPNYLVMEFLAGDTLAARLQNGALPLNEALLYGVQIADALAAAHARGIIHRDLKPANIMLTGSGVKVLDFGIAKFEERAETAEAGVTASGMVIGSPGYMSPEQARAENLDARTDLFSFGAVLYEMLTGRRGFPKAFDWTMPPLEAAPPGLRPVLSRLLAADRNQRYERASDVRNDLERFRREPDSGRAMPRIRRKRRYAAAAAAAAAALLPAGWFYVHRPPKLTDKDTIVLADFDNRTGDAVFEGTLRQGLAAQLQQSPFLSIVPDERIRHTLRLMGKPPDARLTAPVAQEICERTGSAAVLEGSFAPLGSQYVLGLEARNCRDGSVLDSEQMQVAKKEDVLNALGQIATRFRKRAGESLATIRQHDTPLAEATTPSLEALKAYSAGLKAGLREDQAAAVPLLKRAVEIDPNFAMAHAFLGRVYGDIGEAVLAAESTRKAWELRDRAGDREKFFITASYDVTVTGNLEKVQQTCELWAQNYPRDRDAHTMMSAFVYQPFGAFEKSVEETQKAVEIDPDFFPGYVNLAGSYVLLNRLPEAEQTLHLAAARNVEHPFMAIERYQIAFLKRDSAAMQREVALSRGKGALEQWIASEESLTLAYFGQLQQARAASGHAADLAAHVGQRETAALFDAEEALREAFFGNAAEARRAAKNAVTLANGRDVEYGAGLALAVVGDSSQAQKIADDLEKRFPEDTEVRSAYLPEIRAQLALNRNESSKAVELLQPAASYELGLPMSATIAFFGSLYPVYVRGEAWLAAHDGVRAAAEFRKILDHPGVVVNDPMAALAHLQLGRALALRGDRDGARKAYEAFLTLWKDADPDIPVLRQAKTEYGKLQ